MICWLVARIYLVFLSISIDILLIDELSVVIKLTEEGFPILI